MDIQLSAHEGGIILPVQAHAGARRNDVRAGDDGQLRVSVTQAPEKGRANKAIVELLGRKLGLKRSQIELLTGQTAAQKRFLVSGVSQQELVRRLVAITQS